MGIREKIVSGMQDLPTLPTVYSALSEALSNPGSTAAQIADIVATDQAASFRVLKVVNSAFYGFPGRIDTISRAVVILGFDEIRNLILATSVMDLFSKPDSTLDFRPGDFWGHSIGVGLLARMVGQAAGFVGQENLFVAGILHDIGKLALFEFAEEDFGRALAHSYEHGCLIREAERATIDLDHAQVGAMLAEKWRLPVTLRNAIRYHHQGAIEGRPDPLVAAVHLADMLARALEMGYPGDNLVPQPVEHVWETLRLRKGLLSEKIPVVLANYSEATALMLRR